MNREEAKRKFTAVTFNHKTFKQLIDVLYDEFESRTCGNCRYWNTNVKSRPKGLCSKLGVNNIGGCGDYFDRKQKD